MQELGNGRCFIYKALDANNIVLKQNANFTASMGPGFFSGFASPSPFQSPAFPPSTTCPYIEPKI